MNKAKSNVTYMRKSEICENALTDCGLKLDNVDACSVKDKFEKEDNKSSYKDSYEFEVVNEACKAKSTRTISTVHTDEGISDDSTENISHSPKAQNAQSQKLNSESVLSDNNRRSHAKQSQIDDSSRAFMQENKLHSVKAQITQIEIDKSPNVPLQNDKLQNVQNENDKPQNVQKQTVHTKSDKSQNVQIKRVFCHIMFSHSVANHKLTHHIMTSHIIFSQKMSRICKLCYRVIQPQYP